MQFWLDFVCMIVLLSFLTVLLFIMCTLVCYSTVAVCQLFIKPAIDWLIDWLIHWLIDWFIDWFIDWLIDSLIDSLIHWMIHWLIEWVSEWVSDWLIDWCADECSLMGTTLSLDWWKSVTTRSRPQRCWRHWDLSLIRCRPLTIMLHWMLRVKLRHRVYGHSAIAFVDITWYNASD